MGVLYLLVGVVAQASPIEATVHLKAVAVEGESVPVFLEVSDSSDVSEAKVIEAAAPGPARVELVGEPPWTLRVQAEGLWSQPLVIESEEEPPPPIVLWPEARLRAAVRVPRGHELPPGIGLRIQKPRFASSPAIEATVLCPLSDEGALDCAVPSADGVDLRLRTPGFASRFFWDVDLTVESARNLGVLRLRPGASVVGFVEVPAGFELEPVAVRLQPTQSAPTRGGTGREDPLSQQVRVEPGGFFSLTGLVAGSYRLEFTHPDLAPHVLDPVRVIDGGQTEVAEPVRLQEPVPLRLVLDPPLDPHGGDWSVRLFRRTPSGMRVQVEDAQMVAQAGNLDVPAAPGTYEVRVLDSRGVRLHTEEVEASATGGLVVLTIEPIFVQGEVTLGGEPLLARVTFRGESTWTMDAGIDGEFSGYLPRAGEWDVAVEAIEPPVERRTRAVEVEVQEGEDRATLTLHLPDTTLSGIVVDEAGTPIAGAEVTLVDPMLTGREVSVESDEDGEFEVRALDPGEIQAQAVLDEEGGGSWSSRPQVARLVEEETAEVRLVLRPHKELRGRIVTSEGVGVPRAWLELAPFDGRGVLDAPAAQPHSTDESGHFSISLPASIAVVHLTVMAPGHPLTQMEVPLGDLGDVPLAGSAGSLVLDLRGRVDEVPWADPTQPRPALVRPPSLKFPIGPLAQWSSLHDHPWERDANQVTLPRLAPGTYAICWMNAADWLSESAHGRGCVEAEVRPGTTTRLSLDPP